MKALPRLFGLFVGAVVLLWVVPPAVTSQVSYRDRLALRAPPALSAPEGADVPGAPPFRKTPYSLQVAGPPGAAPHGLSVTPSPAAPTRRPGHAAASPVPTLGSSPVLDGLELFIHVPPRAAERQPLRILIALHGMGGQGASFAQGLLAEADRDGWVVVAPSIPYHYNYMDPANLIEEDVRYSDILDHLVDTLPERLGLKLRQHALVYGFSRGAQLAHRLAFLYPECVEAVATLSAGAYTMPAERIRTSTSSQTLPFPFGLGDVQERIGRPVDWEAIKKVSFWVAVGAKDNRSGDVSRAFDSYGGNTRIERARAFSQALQTVGVDTHLTIFPNTDHEVTAEMRQAALDFLRSDELKDRWND